MHVKRSVYCKDSERHEVTGESSRSRDEAAARSANATVDNETDARTGDGSGGRVQSTQADMEDAVEVVLDWAGRCRGARKINGPAKLARLARLAW
jgi:hypothetical protein